MNESSKELPKELNVTWVLLRGWTREKRNWQNFPELLSQTTGERVLAIDLPGAGSETSRSSPLRIHEIVEDVRSRFLREAPSKKAFVVGISMGGMIALDW